MGYSGIYIYIHIYYNIHTCKRIIYIYTHTIHTHICVTVICFSEIGYAMVYPKSNFMAREE